MATINIGNLAFTHKGDYNNSTAYVKNDVVYYSTNGNAYIAKQATTGNAPTNATYWNQFAQGSGGIWNAGLSLGSANQQLRVNSGASALEFYTPTPVTSDFVKITDGTFSTSSDNLVLDGFTSSTYKHYVLRGNCANTGNDGNTLRLIFRNGSTDLTSEYLRAGAYAGINTSNSATGGFGNVSSYNQNHFPFVHSGGTASDVSTFELTLNDLTSTTYYKTIMAKGISRDGSQWVFWNLGGMYRYNNNAVTGLKIYSGSGTNFTSGNYQLYGIK